MDSGEMINEIKRVTGCSLAELSKILGMPPSQVSFYTTGRFKPNKRNQAKIDRLYAGIVEDAHKISWTKIVALGGMLAFLVWLMKQNKE